MCQMKATSLSEGFALGQASDLHCLSKVGWMRLLPIIDDRVTAMLRF
jgi:hypothetical protein